MSWWIGFSEDDENLGAEGAVVLPTRCGQRVPPARVEIAYEDRHPLLRK